MNFCFCESSRCICKTFCSCIHRACLCTECYDLRKRDWCKECGLPFTYRELEQSASGVDTCKCKRFLHCKPLPKKFTVEVHRTPSPMKAFKESGAMESHQPAMSSPDYFSRKDFFAKASTEQGKQKYKSITVIAEQVLFSTDDSESSSEETPVAKEAFDYLSPHSGHHQLKSNQSDFEKLSLNISSTSERVQLPSSQSSSSIGILELPEYEWDSRSQAEPHFSGKHSIVISSIKLSPFQIDNLCLQRPESSTPPTILAEENRDRASLARSVSPIQVITRNKKTVLVSPSGQMHLLPSWNLPSLRPQEPASNEIYDPQSDNSAKASSDSAVKISKTDIPQKNILSTEKPQTEVKEKHNL